MNIPSILLSVLVATATLASTASAQVLLAIDFNQTDAASPTQTGFTGWNITNATNNTPLANTFGIYTVTLIGNGNIIAGRDRAPHSNTATFTQSDLMRDFVQGLARTGATIDNVPTTAANNTSFTISGFAPNTQYIFQLWALDRENNNGNVTSWWNTTNGTGASALHLGNITNSTSASSPANNDAFSVMGVVTSDASGILRFGATNTAPQTVFMNGFQVSVIPEPSTLALLGLGMGALLWRRRRTSKRD